MSLTVGVPDWATTKPFILIALHLFFVNGVAFNVFAQFHSNES
jgi:hypothetical protein